MEITLSPSLLEGTVTAPPSKSCMHRALICAAAADKETKIYCNSFSNDIKATISCLEALGAKIEYEKDFLRVFPIDKKGSEECILDCNESGSTLRFMLPFAASLGKKCTFIGAKRLGERPLLPLLNVLSENGVKVDFNKDSFFPCTIEGKLEGDIFKIPGDISSQFITGLLFALGVMGGGEIEVTTTLKSAPYIDITTSVQKSFGIEVIKTKNGYKIQKGQRYISPEKAEIEGDYSNAAFWLVMGATGKGEKITCENLYEDSFQGDRKIVEILKEMGADIRRAGKSVTVYKSKLKGTELDCENIPDLVPVLCVAASSAEGKTVLKNIKRLREKESDRVKTTLELLSSLGADIKADENSITVKKSSLKGSGVNSANDHRIAMSAAAASVVCDGDIILFGSEAVGKSYPDFYEKFKELGGKIK